MAPESNSKVDRIEVLVNGEDRGTDLSILGYDHEWEYAVFGEDGIPESVRYASVVTVYMLLKAHVYFNTTDCFETC
jgi:hypothetical protein